MGAVNKTRFAILGVLLDGPSTGYEIKALMGRSTVYFWREFDSTIYPMLKALAKEGKVLSEVVYVGKKKKEVYSITPEGRADFEVWLRHPTASEVPRHEFLLKLFFVVQQDEMVRLFRERLEHVEKCHADCKRVEERLASLPDSQHKRFRLKGLSYGMAQLMSEIQWLTTELQMAKE